MSLFPSKCHSVWATSFHGYESNQYRTVHSLSRSCDQNVELSLTTVVTLSVFAEKKKESSRFTYDRASTEHTLFIKKCKKVIVVTAVNGSHS